MNSHSLIENKDRRYDLSLIGGFTEKNNLILMESDQSSKIPSSLEFTGTGKPWDLSLVNGEVPS